MEDLRLTFLIFGVVAIVAILVHGIWTIRKNGKANTKPKFESRDWQNQSDPSLGDDEYDAHGVGSVRVVTPAPPVNHQTNSDDEQGGYDETEFTNEHIEPESELDEQVRLSTSQNEDDAVPIVDASEDPDDELKENHHVNEVLDDDSANELLVDDDLSLERSEMDFAKLAEEHEEEPQTKLYGSVVTQPKPGFQRSVKTPETAHRQAPSSDNSGIPEPPPFLLKSAAASPEVNPDADSIPQPAIAPIKAEPTKSAEPENIKPLHPKAEERTDVRGRVEPEFKLDAEQAPSEAAKPISLAAQARKLVTRRKKSVADVIRKEPELKPSNKANEEQMRIDFSSDEPIANETQSPSVEANATSGRTPTTTQQPTASSQSASNAKASEQPTDVLVLNVRAPEDREITGAALLPMLLTLGLKFGEQDIFHRHVNTNGKGPVLFSLANLFKPGVFDIDNIETFSTRGLSLFMMLPIEGDPQQVFNMMHNAARKLADEFSCQILDGSRGVLTKQGLQKYSERIRDFERKRINR